MGLIITSSLLFALGSVRARGADPADLWPLQRSWRLLSHDADTLWLTAGVPQWVPLQLSPVHDKGSSRLQVGHSRWATTNRPSGRFIGPW